MEKLRSFGGPLGFLWGFLMISLLFCCTIAEKPEDPTGNVNLSPIQQWRNAYKCMLNRSPSCAEKFVLTIKGNLNVNLSDTADYCKQDGCAQHTMSVLNCLHLVKRDLKFANNATVQDLNHTIAVGCSSGFSGNIIMISSARKIYESKTILFISALSALFLTTHLHM